MLSLCRISLNVSTVILRTTDISKTRNLHLLASLDTMFRRCGVALTERATCRAIALCRPLCSLTSIFVVVIWPLRLQDRYVWQCLPTSCCYLWTFLQGTQSSQLVSMIHCQRRAWSPDSVSRNIVSLSWRNWFGAQVCYFHGWYFLPCPVDSSLIHRAWQCDRKKRMLMKIEPEMTAPMSYIPSAALVITISSRMLKSNGDNTHPWSTPMGVRNQSVNSPSTRTALNVASYRRSRSLIIFSRYP